MKKKQLAPKNRFGRETFDNIKIIPKLFKRGTRYLKNPLQEFRIIRKYKHLVRLCTVHAQIQHTKSQCRYRVFFLFFFYFQRSPASLFLCTRKLRNPSTSRTKTQRLLFSLQAIHTINKNFHSRYILCYRNHACRWVHQEMVYYTITRKTRRYLVYLT